MQFTVVGVYPHGGVTLSVAVTLVKDVTPSSTATTLVDPKHNCSLTVVGQSVTGHDNFPASWHHTFANNDNLFVLDAAMLLLAVRFVYISLTDDSIDVNEPRDSGLDSMVPA